MSYERYELWANQRYLYRSTAFQKTQMDMIIKNEPATCQNNINFSCLFSLSVQKLFFRNFLCLKNYVWGIIIISYELDRLFTI